MKFTLIHPSRGRPRQAFNTFVKWVTNATSEIQYILSIDSDDKDKELYRTFFNQLAPFEVTIIENENRNLVSAINRAIPLVKNECVISLSDDFDIPFHWDRELEKVIGDRKEYAVRVQDTIVKPDNPIMTLPIISKTVLDKLGYIYYPEYTGMWADNDLYEVCDKLGVIIHSPLIFPHNHWVNGKAKRDATYDRHNSNEGYALGEKIIARRRKENFGIC